MAIYRGPGGSGDATTDAASQATVATTKAAEAAASASAASSSATTAATEASNASTSASNSETSKIAAVAAQAAAELAETNAETAQAAAEAVLDSFDDRYLGAKASAPSTDNDGNALAEGAMYYDTGDDIIYVWNGSLWQTITTGSGGLQAANNLSDVADASTSRTNLGVAIGTDVQVHSSVLDATTASYTTAEETKLAGIETAADVTDVDNVTAAGALMDSEVTNLAQVKAFDSADYATAAQGTLADSALQSSDIGSTVQGFDADTLKADTADTLTAPFRGTVTTDNDLSFDLNVTNNFKCTPSGAGTLTFTNHTDGQSGFVWLDNSGGHAIAAAATTKINAADLTTISTAGVYTLSYFDNGTNAYVAVSRSFA